MSTKKNALPPGWPARETVRTKDGTEIRVWIDSKSWEVVPEGREPRYKVLGRCVDVAVLEFERRHGRRPDTGMDEFGNYTGDVAYREISRSLPCGDCGCPPDEWMGKMADYVCEKCARLRVVACLAHAEAHKPAPRSPEPTEPFLTPAIIKRVNCRALGHDRS